MPVTSDHDSVAGCRLFSEARSRAAGYICCKWKTLREISSVLPRGSAGCKFPVLALSARNTPAMAAVEDQPAAPALDAKPPNPVAVKLR
jgi:hypothetical protein